MRIWCQRLKLQCVELLSRFAFKFNLRRYNTELQQGGGDYYFYPLSYFTRLALDVTGNIAFGGKARPNIPRILGTFSGF